MLALAMLVMGWVAPAWAIGLSEGESATISFNFTGYSPTPPYDAYGYLGVYTATSNTGLVKHLFFDDLNNPSTSAWSSGFQVEWFTLPPADMGGGVTGGVSPASNESIEYLTITVMTGSISFDPANLKLQMSKSPNDTEYLSGTLVPVTGVPEPTTMLLLASGLIGLWGARKKFKK